MTGSQLCPVLHIILRTANEEARPNWQLKSRMGLPCSDRDDVLLCLDDLLLSFSSPHDWRFQAMHADPVQFASLLAIHHRSGARQSKHGLGDAYGLNPVRLATRHSSQICAPKQTGSDAKEGTTLWLPSPSPYLDC